MAIVREIFRPRSYQRAVRQARFAGKKNFVCLWHRRAGKDRNAMAFTLEEALKRQGVYFHLFPALNQGRRDLWDNILQEKINGVERSFRMIDMFPQELLASKPNETEMQLQLVNGSIYQVMGADDKKAVERLRGPNPIGIVYSEYAHGDYMEAAMDTLEPVFAENDGWQLFAYTPNGENHGKRLYDMAYNNPNWFCQKLTIEDTRRDALGENGLPVVSLETIEEFRRRGKREEWLRQEFWCDFTGFQYGTIYGDMMMKADADGRIDNIPYIANHPVGVLFDLGHADAMAIWFYQVVNGAIRFIDYEEETQKSMQWVVKLLREQKPYVYGRLCLPWDGRAAAEYLGEMGFKNVVCVDKRTPSVQAEIEKIRRNFYRFYFDRLKCAKGIDCLRNYNREFNEEDQVFSEKPRHDKWSHGADALRTGEEAGFEPLMWDHQFDQEVKVEIDFDPRNIYGQRR
jgi:Terminase-like family.